MWSKMFFLGLSVTFMLLTHVESLEPFEKYNELSCSEINAKPAKNVSRAALDDMRYFIGGSRNHLLRAVSSHPDYDSITENEFQDSLCLTRNTTIDTPNTTVASAFGFGRTLVSFNIRGWKDEEGNVFAEGSPKEGFEKLGKARLAVSLTDNENFAFLSSCWLKEDQAGWSLVSKTRTLDEEKRKIVEDHAKKLGYKPENFVFFRNTNCGTGEKE